jgi:hypothetical protein
MVTTALVATSVLAGVCVPVVARADPTADRREPTTSAPVEPDRDPDTALAISIASTATSAALIGASFAVDRGKLAEGLVITGAASLIFTPGFGHGYGRGDLATLGLALRASAIPVATVSLATLTLTELEDLCFSDSCTPSPRDRGDRITRGLAYGGLAVSAALVIAGTAYDLATVRRETREAHTTRKLSIAPSVVQTQHGFVPQLVVGGAF